IREGSAVPAPPEIGHPEQVSNAARYAGSYVSSRGDAIFLRAQGPYLLAGIDGKDYRLQRVDDDAFVIPHPRYERLALSFEQEKDSWIAWWGGVRFSRESEGPPAAPASAPAESLLDKAGYYTNLDPWAGSMFVFARGSDLWL